MREIKNITVFCGSNQGAQKQYTEHAAALGSYLGENNIGLVYGGANVGLMRVCAEHVLEKKGSVTGIITHFLAQKHLTQDNVSQMIKVDTMQERKVKLAEMGDAFIILPGGCGTMEEFFEVFTAAQLGFHDKPIVILNTGGYYDSLANLFQTMTHEKMMLPAHVEMVYFTQSIAEAFHFIKNYQAPKLGKWIDDIKFAETKGTNKLLPQ